MTARYRLPDTDEIKTRDEIIAEYMAEAGGPHDRASAQQALEHAVELGVLERLVGDADGCQNALPTLVSISCPQPPR
jgi:hypothetical protein